MIKLDMRTSSTAAREGRVKQGFRYAMGPFVANVIGTVTEHAIREHMVFLFAKVMG